MVDIRQLQNMLGDILQDHMELLGEAEGFGLNVHHKFAARGGMPFREAQRILADFEKNTKDLRDFLSGLSAVRAQNTPFAGELKALVAKAEAALKVFEADQKKAQEAVEKYEDMLVGENFQKAFEAVRHAILDINLLDDVDLDFKVSMHLEAEPAYSVGQILLMKGTTKVMAVHVGYVADTDIYYGDIVLNASSKTFAKVVQKEGSTRLPKFVRDLVDQVIALDQDRNLGLFKTRKKVELTLVDPDAILAQLREALMNRNDGAEYKPVTKLKYVDGIVRGTIAYTLSYNHHDNSTIKDIMANYQWLDGFLKSLNSSFQIIAGGRKWDVTVTRQQPNYYFNPGFGGAMYHNASEIEGFIRAAHPERLSPIPKMSVQEWKEVAQRMRGWISPNARTVEDYISALKMNSPLNRFTVENVFEVVASPAKTASSTNYMEQRVASLYLRKQAGGSDFMMYVPISDVKKAFREAVSEARHESGHGGYTGTIAEKSDYSVRSHDSMTQAQAFAFADRDIERNQKWGPAFAVPVSEGQVLKEESLTVDVEAKDEATARRMGALRIKATGRVYPNAVVSVEVTKVQKTDTGKFTVTGTRKQTKPSQIVGWVFYGNASS